MTDTDRKFLALIDRTKLELMSPDLTEAKRTELMSVIADAEDMLERKRSLEEAIARGAKELDDLRAAMAPHSGYAAALARQNTARRLRLVAVRPASDPTSK